ncbi:MAG TPA: cation diffusion facilitator family transporter [Actinocrinis sp.]|nr:cation diffusion facilitator family transporter [Actinocrinis sp.]
MAATGQTTTSDDGPTTGPVAPGGPGRSKPDHAAGAVWAALAANVAIALAKAAAGLLSSSPALYAEAAHSAADSLNEIFLLASLRRSRRAADAAHPFGYGMERFFWSLLAAVGIFVTGGCFSFYQGIRAWLHPEPEGAHGFLIALGVLAVSLVAEGSSLLKALTQRRRRREQISPGAGREKVGDSAGDGDSPATSGVGEDPALRTIVAEDSTAVAGVLLAAAGVVLHLLTGNARWEAVASAAIGALLIYVAFRLASVAQGELIGEAVTPAVQDELRGFLTAQAEIDTVTDLLTMRLGPESTLLAVRVDLNAGYDSEEVELVCMRIKGALRDRWPELDHVFLDITDAPTERAAA